MVPGSNQTKIFLNSRSFLVIITQPSARACGSRAAKSGTIHLRRTFGERGIPNSVLFPSRVIRIPPKFWMYPPYSVYCMIFLRSNSSVLCHRAKWWELGQTGSHLSVVRYIWYIFPNIQKQLKQNITRTVIRTFRHILVDVDCRMTEQFS